MSPKNICPCPLPPGGQAVCESRQLAICRVRDGGIEADCIDLPSLAGLATESAGIVIANYALARIYDSSRDASQSLTFDEIAVLQDSVKNAGVGSIVAERGGEVSFRLPPHVWKYVASLGEERGTSASLT